MLSVNVLETEEDYCVAQNQIVAERRALKLASAWSDLYMVQQAAGEVVRRFGAIHAADHGLLRLHKEPLFLAFQTACVVGYTRVFGEPTGLDARHSVYPKPEWQDLHETLFVWKERVSGELGTSFRHFVVARELATDSNNRYIIGELTSTLEPQRHFSMLFEMCSDRMALLWSECQDAIAERYPVLYQQSLLGLSGINNRP